MTEKPAIRQRGVSTPETEAEIETGRQAMFRLIGAKGWLRRGVWAPEQAAWLLAGVDPDAGFSVSEVTAGLRDYIAKLAQSFPSMRVEQAPAKWLDWAEGAGIPVPSEFQPSTPAATKPIGGRVETTYLNIIGALLELVRTPRPGRDSDAAVIRELIDSYSDKPGISKTTLETKFAEARRRLNST